MRSNSLLALSLSLLAFAPVARADGGVRIVNRQGNHEEGNKYTRKDAVYFTGGPTQTCAPGGVNCLAPGLADGDWFFLVTDPAGTVQLSLEPVSERRLTVSGGVITAVLGRTHASAPIGPCGSRIVRLIPFATSPYSNQEYKLWLTRVEDYDALNGELFGFVPALCKSDNFKVGTAVPQAMLVGHKYYDFDQSGTWNPLTEPAEVPVGGWRIELWRNNQLDGVTFTDQDGRYVFLRDRSAMPWEVREIAPNGFVNDAVAGATWLATTPRAVSVVANADCAAGPDFGNVQWVLFPLAGRSKGFWSNNNGRARLLPCDPTWRDALTTRNGLPVNLRRPISSADPLISVYAPSPTAPFLTAHNDLARYLIQPANGHAGYQLAREIAATILNNTCGFMQGPMFIDAHQDGVLVSLDALLAGGIALLSEPGAGQTGPNDPYQDLRNHMLMCLNEFGGINNTGDPTSPQTVYTRGGEPTRFRSLYEPPPEPTRR